MEGPERRHFKFLRILISPFLYCGYYFISFMYTHFPCIPQYFLISKQPQTRGEISRCDISLSTSKFNLRFNKGFHNPDPSRKRTAPFGAKITLADSTLKRLLPLYFKIQILDPDRKSFCTILEHVWWKIKLVRNLILTCQYVLLL